MAVYTKKQWILRGAFLWGGAMWLIGFVPQLFGYFSNGAEINYVTSVVMLPIWLILGAVFGLLMHLFLKKSPVK